MLKLRHGKVAPTISLAREEQFSPEAATPKMATLALRAVRSGLNPGLKSRTCNLVLAARHRVGHIQPYRRCGRVAEGGGLLNRYRVVKPYRGFESLRLRHRQPLEIVGLQNVREARLSQVPVTAGCHRGRQDGALYVSSTPQRSLLVS
jgi:hypothetical protein